MTALRTRETVWRCDGCGVESVPLEVREGRPPVGWLLTVRDEEISHWCPECSMAQERDEEGA